MADSTPGYTLGSLRDLNRDLKLAKLQASGFAGGADFRSDLAASALRCEP